MYKLLSVLFVVGVLSAVSVKAIDLVKPKPGTIYHYNTSIKITRIDTIENSMESASDQELTVVYYHAVDSVNADGFWMSFQFIRWELEDSSYSNGDNAINSNSSKEFEEFMNTIVTYKLNRNGEIVFQKGFVNLVNSLSLPVAFDANLGRILFKLLFEIDLSGVKNIQKDTRWDSNYLLNEFTLIKTYKIESVDPDQLMLSYLLNIDSKNEQPLSGELPFPIYGTILIDWVSGLKQESSFNLKLNTTLGGTPINAHVDVSTKLIGTEVLNAVK